MLACALTVEGVEQDFDIQLIHLVEESFDDQLILVRIMQQEEFGVCRERERANEGTAEG